MAARSLTVGNAAKLYCLDLIDRRAAEADSLRVLDLGCGDGRNFVELLRRRPNVAYVGFDPSREAVDEARRKLGGLDAQVDQGEVYALHLDPPADVVVSFSVLEHVRRRGDYLAAVAANLAPAGVALVNYDAGHFGQDATLVDRVKTSLGQQSRVDADDFRRDATAAGLRIVEEKGFNTELKVTFRSVPEELQPAFMERWLELELGLNELGLGGHEQLWRTRNFVLEHA